jgi:uracil-DNA glycosylase family 4
MKNLNTLLEEIRNCQHCETWTDSATSRCTPLVYGTSSSDILVVSEKPPKRAWKSNLGEIWREGLFKSGDRGIPHTLCNWLGLAKEEAKRRFFWIQRANCHSDTGQHYMFQHCSSRYLHKTIELVKPTLIITLGKKAAEFFYQFNTLEQIIGKPLTYLQNNQEYPLVTLYHPSWKTNKIRKENIEHQDALQMVKIQI